MKVNLKIMERAGVSLFILGLGISVFSIAVMADYLIHEEYDTITKIEPCVDGMGGEIVNTDIQLRCEHEYKEYAGKYPEELYDNATLSFFIGVITTGLGLEMWRW